jgi:hypothetical protein
MTQLPAQMTVNVRPIRDFCSMKIRIQVILFSELNFVP